MKPHRRISLIPGEDGAAALLAPALGHQERATAVDIAVTSTCDWLLANQQADGHWVAELEGDTILESEYILLLAYLGEHDSPLARKAAQYILEHQLETGGWAQFHGGAIDISGSVKAYFALKICGHDPASSAMQRARAAILAHGGADAVNSFTRFYLALLGQISYDQCPAVPPELVLLPRWFPVNIYRMSAWSRTILVPLAIMWAYRPVAALDPALGICELFLKPPAQWPPLRCPGQSGAPGWLSWDSFFRGVDGALKLLERAPWRPLRGWALRAARRWMIERFQGSDGLGAIFPPMVWSVIALRASGYSDTSPEVVYCLERLRGLVIEEADSAHLQPCKSPVWDTAISLRALRAARLSEDHLQARHAVDWLLEREVRRKGDWSAVVASEPGGWCFEYENEFYPDVDDTIMVVMALVAKDTQDNLNAASADGELQLVDQAIVASPAQARTRFARFDRTASAVGRGVAWVLALQNRDGGWGAFDRDNDHEFLCHVPFADHNAMIDPSTPDLTGRVLEMLGKLGRGVGDPVVDRAIEFMRASQEPDGSWFGRWGVNYIYGTWQALAGLAAVGVPSDDPLMARGARWLLAYQQASGAWGESPASYAEPHLRGQGPATASQTAWALLGLLAAGETQHPAVERGIDYLLREQGDTGIWYEPQFTGTGFPQVFYLRYHYYPIYFPLLALAQWRHQALSHANRATAQGS